MAHIRAFNAIYRHAYQPLRRMEKRLAGKFVDWLIDHIERREWASRICGVV